MFPATAQLCQRIGEGQEKWWWNPVIEATLLRVTLACPSEGPLAQGAEIQIGRSAPQATGYRVASLRSEIAARPPLVPFGMGALRDEARLTAGQVVRRLNAARSAAAPTYTRCAPATATACGVEIIWRHAPQAWPLASLWHWCLRFRRWRLWLRRC